MKQSKGEGTINLKQYKTNNTQTGRKQKKGV